MGNPFSKKPTDEPQEHALSETSMRFKHSISASTNDHDEVVQTFEEIEPYGILGGITPMFHVIFGVTAQKVNVLMRLDPKKETLTASSKPKIDFMNYCGTVMKSERVAIICGGISFDLKQITPACYELDFLTMETRQLPLMHDYRYTFPVCYYKKRIYVVGGRVFGNDNVHSLLDKCERFDYRTQTWQRIANLNKKRCTSALAVVNGQVWVFGGYSNGGKRTRKVERYLEEKDQWEVVPFKLSIGVDAFNMLPANDESCFFIYGGKLQDNTSNKIVKYNLASNTYFGLQNSSFDNLISKCFAVSDNRFLIVGDKRGTLVGELFDTREERVVKVMTFGNFPTLSDLKKFNTIYFTVELKAQFPLQRPRWNFDFQNPYNGKSEAEKTTIMKIFNRKNYIFGTDMRSYMLEIDSVSGQIKELGVPTALNLACFQGVERITPSVVMFCGGVNRAFGKIYDSAYFLNLETHDVERLPNMPVAKYTFSLVRLNNFVYAIGGRVYGESSQSVIGSVDRFNLLTKTWQSIRGLSVPRCTANAHVVNNRIFIMGGYTKDNQRTDKIEVFSESNGQFMAYGMYLKEPTEAGFSYQRNELVLFCGGRRNTDRSEFKEVLDFSSNDMKSSQLMHDTLRNKAFLQKGCVFQDFLFIFNGSENVEKPNLDCVFLKTFENMKMEEMFEEERIKLTEFSKNLIGTLQKYTDGNEFLKHDSFLLASNS